MKMTYNAVLRVPSKIVVDIPVKKHYTPVDVIMFFFWLSNNICVLIDRKPNAHLCDVTIFTKSCFRSLHGENNMSFSGFLSKPFQKFALSGPVNEWPKCTKSEREKMQVRL